MKLSRVMLIVVLAALLSGCGNSLTKDIQIESQADPKANFDGYKTYAWWGAAEILNDPYGMWEPPSFDADTEIKQLLDRELSKHGFTVDNSAPDMVVAFAAGVDMTALKEMEDPDSGGNMLANVPQGGLVVALVDSETGFLIWVGTASGEVQEGIDSDKVKKRLDYAVTELIKSIPK